MYVVSIAARHMKSRSITWVAAAMIAAVVVMYLLVISVVEGFKSLYMDKLQNILAHATVSVGHLTGGIEKPEGWAAELAKAAPGIKGVTVGIDIPAMAIFTAPRTDGPGGGGGGGGGGDDSAGSAEGQGTLQTIGTLRGVDFDQELKYGRLKEVLTPKSLDNLGEHEAGGRMRPDCVVGGYWRDSYGLSIGDHVTFIFTKEDGDPKPMEFVIRGFFSGESSYLENAAYVDRKTLAEVIQVKGCAKTLSIWLDDPNRPDLQAVCDTLNVKMKDLILRDSQAPPGLKGDQIEKWKASRAKRIEIETWQDKDNKFYKAMTRENAMMRFVLILFLILVGFIVFLIFGRLIAEKKRDIGALRALGATPGGVCACFVAQGLLIGVCGVAIGLLLSYGIVGHLETVVYFSKTYLHFDPYPADSFGVASIPHVTLPFDVIVISVLSIVTAVLGALWPALLASWLNPVECLRHE